MKISPIVPFLLSAAVLAPPVRAQDDPFAAMRARAIGPAGMSGRVSDVEVALADRNVIYVGAATGGVSRSVDGGLTWTPVFDGKSTLSIGAVAVFQPNPDIVWVGTGEGNPRNSAGVGRGLFRSLDGGETWALMGLERSERIHRILTHPSDPDVVYVGVLGPAWSDGDERGVYRTLDGGETWERVLWQSARTGVADMVMDPENPQKLFAALWDFRREPDFLTSGGPGSGLFVTHDGGDHWRRITEEDGFPSGELGRIGVAIARSEPDVVYALVEASPSALLRSDDGGWTWRTLSDEEGINPRPFYYADLRVDPLNENRLYRLASGIQVTEDLGRTWRTVVPSGVVHGDVHELWIDPEDSRRMIIGNDGGIAFTYDRGAHWRFVENLTFAQFYHIDLDNEVPYNVYGGLQDNGSWYGPSTVWENKGILNAHWRRVGGGDGFTVMNDFSSPEHGYSMSQGGNLQRFNKVTGLQESIRPVHPDGETLRFNWNAGLTVDPFDSTTIYLGSQFLYRSADHGGSWDIISPDLTTDDPQKQRAYQSGGLTLDGSGAEMHTTIIAIGPSHLEDGVIWVGTDDGNVQLTRDGGATWANVRDRLGDLPEGIWIPDVQPSRHVAGRAYLVAEDHRRGDWTPRVYVTEDHGETWRSLATPDLDGFVHAIEEDPVNPDLLFLGTEFGLYVSMDRGNHWIKYTSGVPSVPIRDLKVHPRDGDLVLGTHGRGILVVDDIRPLRELAADPEIRSSTAHVFVPPPALRVNVAEGIGYRSTGHAMQQAEIRPVGALVSFWTAQEGEGRLEVTDRDGALIYSRSLSAGAGVNRVSWSLRPGGDTDPQRFPAMEALPGRYTVTVALGEAESSAELDVVQDPRSRVTAEDLRAKLGAMREMARVGQEASDARDRLEQALEGVDMVLRTLAAEHEELRDQGIALREALRQALQRLFTGPECRGLCRFDVVADAVRAPMRALGSAEGAPSGNEEIMMRQAVEAAREIEEVVGSLMAGDVARYRDALLAAGYTPFSGLGPPGGER
jgi:photosystem II stability/assembly factor-like uncharacterized protein